MNWSFRHCRSFRTEVSGVEEYISEESGERKRAFRVAAEAGKILLGSGAEIFRVEETMLRIAEACGIENMETYIIANGVFATSESSGEPLRVAINHVGSISTDLGKIEAVNELSRELVAGTCSLSEAERRLTDIRRMHGYSLPVLLLGYLLGAGCFCYILGGSLKDSLGACAIGLLLGLYMKITSRPSFTQPLQTITASMLVTVAALAVSSAMPFLSLDHMIIGGLIPLVPGVSFTNSVRDFIEHDYVSGLIRLMDALLIVICMAAGAAAVWGIKNYFG